MEDLFALFPGAVGNRLQELQRDVLVQAAAKSNVHELRSAADGEDRPAGLPCGAKERHFELRPAVRRKRQVGPGQLAFAVEGGADIVPAGKDEAVQALHEIRDRCIEPQDGEGNTACCCHGTAVIQVEYVQVPRGLFRKVHGYADKGLHNVILHRHDQVPGAAYAF